MSVRTYAQVLRRNALLIILCALILGAGAYAYASTLPKSYRSYASVIVIPEQGQNTSELIQGSTYVQNIVQSYALLVTTPYVLDPVIDDLSLPMSAAVLANRITVQTPLNTVMIELSVVDSSPQEAQAIAAAVTDSLVKSVDQLSPKVGNKPAVKLTIVSPASLPRSYVAPNRRLYAMVGGGIGLLLGLGIAVLRQLLRSRVSGPEDVAEITDLPVLGSVPLVSRSASVPLEVTAVPGGQVSESLRGVAANLRFVTVDRPARIVVVTSARSGEGKTSLAVALGLTIAETGRRTLIIDADLRHPSVAPLIGIEGSVGLTTVMLHDCSLEDAIQPWGNDHLSILPGGRQSPNPGQLMSSGQLAELLHTVSGQFDLVIVDTPPVLAVSDALWTAPATDGVIVVGRVRKTPLKSLHEAIEAVSATHARVLGIVLNASRDKRDQRYHSGGESSAHQGLRARLQQGEEPLETSDEDKAPLHPQLSESSRESR